MDRVQHSPAPGLHKVKSFLNFSPFAPSFASPSERTPSRSVHGVALYVGVGIIPGIIRAKFARARVKHDGHVAELVDMLLASVLVQGYLWRQRHRRRRRRWWRWGSRAASAARQTRTRTSSNEVLHLCLQRWKGEEADCGECVNFAAECVVEVEVAWYGMWRTGRCVLEWARTGCNDRMACWQGV